MRNSEVERTMACHTARGTAPGARLPQPVRRKPRWLVLCAAALVPAFGTALAQPADVGDTSPHETSSLFTPMDVFELEWAQSPQISPDGVHVVYRRSGFDTLKDRRRGNLWLLETGSTTHRKLTDFEGVESSPRWSPEGDRVAYTRDAEDGSAEIFVHWLASGQHARITRLPAKPSKLRWSPDGSQIAFEMKVAAEPPVVAKRPAKPEGATWADAPRVTDRLRHERDGSGYIDPGFDHVFVVPADGGTARQVSSGDYHHRSPAWAADGSALLVSGNRRDDWEYDYRNSELYRIGLATGEVAALTSTSGPDRSPLPSPDGEHLAWLGFADKRQAYQVTRLRVKSGSGKTRELLGGLDRSIGAATWASDSSGLYVSYDDHGRTRIAFVSLDGDWEKLADDLGGTSIGRPYGGGSFSVANDGTIAFTQTRPEYPADVALVGGGSEARLLTRLNEDVLAHRSLGETRELRWSSSVDGREIQGWIVTPPGFDPGKKYPLVVENHGGPISNYGERFSPEMQLYAAAGYVVFFPNARGSTGYGEEFANLLYHNYPGEDYNDVMDGMNAVLEQGFIDPERLFVTGGSAGGIMTAWMIGKSDRFRAAAVIKPVMNWYSKTLNADNWFYYYETRIPGTPWTNPEDYLRFSPISLVGDVNTPTLVMVGLNDLRTPPSQAKQLYHALKYRRVPTVLVELPGASHFISRRPSQLIDKIGNILAWFERYDESEATDS